MGKPIATVQDYINNNSNKEVRITRKLSRDDYDQSYETLWSGMLYDVPKEFRSCEVVDDAWLKIAQIREIIIMF